MTEYIVRAQDLESGLILCGTHIQGEIVRCRDCEHWATLRKFTGYCIGKAGKPDGDGFCAWGKRRES